MQKQASNLDLITYQNAIMNSSAKPIEPIRSGLVDGRVAPHYVALRRAPIDVRGRNGTSLMVPRISLMDHKL